jgi:hypothetical protein
LGVQVPADSGRHQDLTGKTVAAATDLDALRRRLSDQHRDFVSALWKFFRDHNQWVPSRIAHQHFGKDAVQANLAALGPSLVQAYRDDGKDYYRLTFLGMLLTDQGSAAEDLLVRYLEYIRDRQGSDPRVEWVGSQEVETALRLSVEQSRLLRQIIRLSHWWGGGSAFGEREWTVGVPVDVDELAAETDLRRYVREHVLKHFPIESRPLATEGKSDAPGGAFRFIEDAALRERLAADWHEAQDVCHVLGWKSCVILCGGILEALLADALTRSGSPATRRRLLLGGLVTAAVQRRALTKDALRLSPTLLAFRGLIASGSRRRKAAAPDRTEAEAALEAVRSCLQQLAETRSH